MSCHLLLDEMFSAAAADGLRDRGVDAYGIDERGHLRGVSDAEVLALATSEGRAVVTLNTIDFLELDRRSHSTGERHNGIVLVNSKRFSHAKSRLAPLLDALAALAKSGASLNGHVTWLK